MPGVEGAATGREAGRARVESLSLSIHGVGGVVDLVVPTGASVADVAREYAEQAGLPGTPELCTRRGQPLPPDLALADAGVVTGALLVAVGAVAAQAPPAGRRSGRSHEGRPAADEARPGPLSAAWFTLAAGAAGLAGWAATRFGDDDLRTTTALVLAAAAVLAVLPVGRLAAHRVVTAPAFAGAAAYVVVHDPAPERLPTVLGVAALAAAVVAGVGRALGREADEALRVWVVAGVAGFGVSTGAALAGLEPPVVWAFLLVAAMLATRFVPMLAIDVPDQYLLDLERLAVTAWSARERPRGRRGRIVVPHQAVAVVAERGTRTVVAASAAVLAVVALSAPLLLASADLPIDRVGARVLVGTAGAALLLAGRSYRHGAARALLRLAGLVCWAALAVVLLDMLGGTGRGLVVAAAVGVAGLLVVVAVAVGRGWRSAWWSRRAEVAEGVSGAFALASVVVAVGLFRRLWELTGQGLGG